jgi:MFS transporter, DHA2 family, multidrug resistance protein
VFGSIGVAIYRGSLDLPGRLPSAAADIARDTLGGALEIARDLPAEIAAPLVDAARVAFTTGLQVTAAISALASLALALFAFLAFRSVGEGASLDDEVVNEIEAEPATARTDELVEAACG